MVVPTPEASPGAAYAHGVAPEDPKIQTGGDLLA